MERPDDALPQPVVMRLVVEPDEPLRGTLAVNEQDGIAFAGWIDLMAAIDAARRRPELR
jgi:hypothetical protein